MSSKKKCLFCQLSPKNPLGGVFIFITKDFFCRLNPYPQSRGHALIIPKKHFDDLAQMPSKLRSQFFETAIKAANLLMSKLKAAAYELKINNQVYSLKNDPKKHIGHLHLHIIPHHQNQPPLPEGKKVSREKLLKLKRIIALD
jgi:histidine triad (HIT) family protein